MTDASLVLTATAAAGVLERMHGEICALRNRVATLERKNAALTREIEREREASKAIRDRNKLFAFELQSGIEMILRFDFPSLDKLTQPWDDVGIECTSFIYAMLFGPSYGAVLRVFDVHKPESVMTAFLPEEAAVLIGNGDVWNKTRAMLRKPGLKDVDLMHLNPLFVAKMARDPSSEQLHGLARKAREAPYEPISTILSQSEPEHVLRHAKTVVEFLLYQLSRSGASLWRASYRVDLQEESLVLSVRRILETIGVYAFRSESGPPTKILFKFGSLPEDSNVRNAISFNKFEDFRSFWTIRHTSSLMEPMLEVRGDDEGTSASILRIVPEMVGRSLREHMRVAAEELELVRREWSDAVGQVRSKIHIERDGASMSEHFSRETERKVITRDLLGKAPDWDLRVGITFWDAFPDMDQIEKACFPVSIATEEVHGVFLSVWLRSEGDPKVARRLALSIRSVMFAHFGGLRPVSSWSSELPLALWNEESDLCTVLVMRVRRAIRDLCARHPILGLCG